jgi:hypothetical protein
MKIATASAIAQDLFVVSYSNTALVDYAVPWSYLERVANGGFEVAGTDSSGLKFSIEARNVDVHTSGYWLPPIMERIKPA